MGRPKGSRDKVRRVRWKHEPELQAAMAALDHEHLGRRECAEAFERATGVPLTERQVSDWRSANGRADDHRVAHRNGRHGRSEVGYEYVCPDGYVRVKVADLPEVPRSRDNWRYKHVLAWEEAHGEPLPSGMAVTFVDGDRGNFDPENLMAVPKRVLPLLSKVPRDGGAEEFEARVNVAKLTCAMADAERGAL